MQEVIFKRPDGRLLEREGYTAVDMHSHSLYSDSLVSIKRLIKRMKQLHFGFALTDHNEVRGVKKALNLAKQFNFRHPIISGIELSFNGGVHILSYFFTYNDALDFFKKHVLHYREYCSYSKKFGLQFFTLKKSISEYIDILKDYNSMTVLAHPCNNSYSNVVREIFDKNLIKKFNCIEAFNANLTREQNIKCQNLAKKYNKPFIAGADAESYFALGNAATISSEDSVSGFLESINKKNNQCMGLECNKLAYYDALMTGYLLFPKYFIQKRLFNSMTSLRSKLNRAFV